MRLKARIDGQCDVCSVALIDRAFSVVVTSHVVVTQAGEPGIKEEHEKTTTVCPNCYGAVYRALDKG